MNTPTIDDTRPTDRRATGRREAADRRPRRRWIAGAAAAAAIGAISVAAVVTSGGDGDDDRPDQVAAPPLELSLGDSSALASCIPFDTTTLAEMSPAFAATAVGVADGTVTLAVDEWYAGGDAATVELAAPTGMQPLIDGFDFEVGGRYLITASGGTVNFCGYSGPATADLTAAFDAAFG